MIRERRSNAAFRFLSFLFLVLLAVSVIAFVLENQETVEVQFLGWLMPRLPVSLYILLPLLFGLAVGPLLSWCFRSKKPRG
ncbi:lipopolysaccharide assembly protein LapA domain-containing protein [Pseudomonas sp. efr-133-TYG-5]|uniref:lipopolysaccharide assembly protein LapA domain-containing protein n=1 Tax=Pseudomonas sp. efr-133-TYG-5 TaxID=3040310 RepID=UPI002557B176|nr:lipopolysaccharide assembly protein LapA domain-containing protein [Pseudomonas sp. efr-133-TYG-5]